MVDEEKRARWSSEGVDGGKKENSDAERSKLPGKEEKTSMMSKSPCPDICSSHSNSIFIARASTGELCEHIKFSFSFHANQKRQVFLDHKEFKCKSENTLQSL